MPGKILPRRVAESRIATDRFEIDGEIMFRHDAEHLSSLTTAPDQTPPDPNSSLKKLRNLNEINKMKITKVELILRKTANEVNLLILDSKSGEFYEKFGIEEVKSPIYKESNDPKDYFNNLLMFNVDAKINSTNGPSQHEMHIFQCCGVQAHVIVEEILEAQQSPRPTIFRSEHRSSPTPQRIPIGERNISADRDLTRETFSEYLQNENFHNKKNLYPEKKYLTPLPDYEEDGTVVAASNVKKVLEFEQKQKKAYIDAEITLLNMCFDDIESYVGSIRKIQRTRSLNSFTKSIAEDTVSNPGKEKKKKKRFIFRKKSPTKEKEANLPRNSSYASLGSENEIQISDTELIDLFEKVKFAIILLSRLQGFVTDPNPPLITHRLFSIIHHPIEFIRDPDTGKPELARRIIKPLFTEAATDLIQESLIEPEISMWHELGDAWCMPREHWPNKDPHVYIPEFKCGFKPDPEQYHFTLFDADEANDVVAEDCLSLQMSNSVHQSVKPRRENREFLENLLRRNATIARVKRDFTATNPRELSLEMGEYVEMLDDSRNWNKLRNSRGVVGYSPFNVLEFNL